MNTAVENKGTSTPITEAVNLSAIDPAPEDSAQAVLARLMTPDAPRSDTRSIIQDLATLNHEPTLDKEDTRFRNPIVSRIGRAMEAVGGSKTDIITAQTQPVEGPDTDAGESSSPQEASMNDELLEAQQHILALKEENITLIDDLVEDRGFRSEVLDQVLTTVTKPYLEFMVNAGKMTQKQSDELIAAINRHRKIGGQFLSEFRQNPYEMLNSFDSGIDRALLYRAVGLGLNAGQQVIKREVRQELNWAATAYMGSVQEDLEEKHEDEAWTEQIGDIFNQNVYVDDDQRRLNRDKMRDIGGLVQENYENRPDTVFNPLWVAIADTQEMQERGADLIAAVDQRMMDFDAILTADPEQLIYDFTVSSLSGKLPPEVYSRVLMMLGSRKYSSVFSTSEGETVEYLPQLLATPQWQDKLQVLRQNDSDFNAVANAIVQGGTEQDVRGAIQHYAAVQYKKGELPARVFVHLANKAELEGIVGKRELDDFLAALPTETNERRNAFVHNKYDRTTAFMDTLINGVPDMEINRSEMQVLTNYVRQYGLAKLPEFYDYYRNLTKHQQGEIDLLPEAMTSQGITSFDALNERFKNLNTIYSPDQIDNLDGFGPLERKLLEVTTGYSTHSFQGDTRPSSMEQILADFEESKKAGEIKPLPDGYEPGTIAIGAKEITGDRAPSGEAMSFYHFINGEQAALEQFGSADLYDAITDTLQQKIQSLEAQQDNTAIPEQARQANARELGELRQQRESLVAKSSNSDTDVVASLDQLVASIIDLSSDKKVSSAIQRIIGQSMIRMALAKTDGTLSLATLLPGSPAEVDDARMAQVIQEVQHHLLGQDKASYWSETTQQKMDRSKLARKRTGDLFKSDREAIMDAVATSADSIPSGNTAIQVIPDRGLIGEMSGYLADACYTKEYPLLTHPYEPIPVKFVQNTGGSSEFAGSTLFFEVDTTDGERALMVRALNLPGEETINIAAFTEQFFDYAAATAERRGLSKVIVPQNSGALSNYPNTINYITDAYLVNRPITELNGEFNFNGYDITTDCKTVREVTLHSEAK